MSFIHWLGNAVKTAGKPFEVIGHAVQGVGGAIGKEIGKIPVIGGPLHAVFDVGFMVGFGPIIATGDVLNGQRIDKVVLGQLKQELADVKEIAPYAEMVLSLIPGIGTGISAALAAGLALASGQSISTAMIDGIKAGIPGGVLAAAAFDVAQAGVNAAVKGQKVTWQLISQTAVKATGDLLSLPPQARDAIAGALDTAGQLARGVKVDVAVADGAIDAAATELGSAGVKALTIGVAMAHSAFVQKVQKPQLTSPTLKNRLMAIGQQVGATDPTVSAARLTVQNKNGFDIGVGLSRQQITSDQLTTLRNSLTPADRQAFDLALSLHIGRVGNPTPPGIPSAKGQAGYFITFGMQGADPADKQAMMTKVIGQPVSKVGAGVAVNKIMAERAHWWVRLWDWLF